MVILSRNDIERIAERVIQAYKKLPELENKKVYNISPKILLERLLNLRIDYGHLSQDRQTLGVTITRVAGEVEIYNACDEAEIYLLDGRTVLIEQDLRDDATQKGRHNMTQMHEACHHILERIFPGEYCCGHSKKFRCIKEKGPRVIEDWEEWQVDTLSAAIIMPKDLVKQALYLFGFNGQIPLINRIHAKEDYMQFSMIADFLGVSKQALSIRLSHLGLVDRNDFDDPYALLDVYNE